jgi:hypothetical protein
MRREHGGGDDGREPVLPMALALVAKQLRVDCPASSTPGMQGWHRTPLLTGATSVKDGSPRRVELALKCRDGDKIGRKLAKSGPKRQNVVPKCNPPWDRGLRQKTPGQPKNRGVDDSLFPMQLIGRNDLWKKDLR